mgnify:CR=1 FL=1
MIKNKEDWWKCLEDNWVDLITILSRFLPIADYDILDEKGNIKISEHRMIVEIEKLKSEKDPKIARYLFGAWIAAPDHPSIHKIKGWYILCDLLNEEIILYEN